MRSKPRKRFMTDASWFIPFYQHNPFTDKQRIFLPRKGLDVAAVVRKITIRRRSNCIELLVNSQPRTSVSR